METDCPHCAKGNAPRLRPETGEWVHDFARVLDEAGRARAMGQTICCNDPKWKAKQAKN